jgi:hypothetical protein
MTESLLGAALRRENAGRPPVWMMRQAGRYHSHYQMLKRYADFIQLCKDPALAAETAMGPVHDFNFDAAILFSDLLFPLEAIGMGLTIRPGPARFPCVARMWPGAAALAALQFSRSAPDAPVRRDRADRFVGRPFPSVMRPPARTGRAQAVAGLTTAPTRRSTTSCWTCWLRTWPAVTCSAGCVALFSHGVGSTAAPTAGVHRARARDLLAAFAARPGHAGHVLLARHRPCTGISLLPFSAKDHGAIRCRSSPAMRTAGPSRTCGSENHLPGGTGRRCGNISPDRACPARAWLVCGLGHEICRRLRRKRAPLRRAAQGSSVTPSAGLFAGTTEPAPLLRALPEETPTDRHGSGFPRCRRAGIVAARTVRTSRSAVVCVLRRNIRVARNHGLATPMCRLAGLELYRSGSALAWAHCLRRNPPSRRQTGPPARRALEGWTSPGD